MKMVSVFVFNVINHFSSLAIAEREIATKINRMLRKNSLFVIYNKLDADTRKRFYNYYQQEDYSMCLTLWNDFIDFSGESRILGDLKPLICEVKLDQPIA